ncbi:MFS transporter [Arthrobacter sulfonylureivorans]|uniref:MFS transporter n=1 Tax=Arthrobacter sulfonylureivorans TaxID=2486855 RepID=UPI0039E4381F
MSRETIGREARTSGLGVAFAGMLLIAATYGMARFGVGLFAPLLAVQRPELAEVLGWAAAAQFTSYSVAALAAARFVDRAPRAGLLLAGATAALGCLGVAVAGSPAIFVVAVFIGGMGGGFASPALVPVIDAAVPRRASATAQSLVNSGTAVGVIVAGLVASAASSVGPAWVFMATMCATTAVAVWHSAGPRAELGAAARATAGPTSRLPGNRSKKPPSTSWAGRDMEAASSPLAGSRRWRLLAVPGVAAVIAGAGSALIWTFGPLLLTEAGSVAPERAGWLWITLGIGGFLGIFTGTLVRRLGTRGGWCFFAAALALASAGVAASVLTGSGLIAYASMAVFGAGYMSLSGVLILWARTVWPGTAGAGTSMLFIALATGQALGSAGFGLARGAMSPVVLAALAAGFLILGGLTGLIRGRRPSA